MRHKQISIIFDSADHLGTCRRKREPSGAAGHFNRTAIPSPDSEMDDVDDDPPQGFAFPLLFTWPLPPLPSPPDLLVLATDIAGVGGVDLPVEVTAIDSFPTVTDAPERSLSIVARMSVDLSDVYLNNDDAVARNLERCKQVSLYLLEHADAWLVEP